MTGENVTCQGWAALLDKVSPETGGVQVPAELKEYVVWGWGVGPGAGALLCAVGVRWGQQRGKVGPCTQSGVCV